MWALVINPTAGGGKGAQIGRRVAGYFSSKGLQYQIVTGVKADSVKGALENFLDNNSCQGVISVGGDGLAHLVMQIVVPRNIPFSVMPAGTGNDFLRSLGWDLDEIEKQLDFVTTQPSSPIDLGLVDSEWFGAILSTGFDSVVNQRANSMKWPRGASKYTLAIALELSRFNPINYSIQLDSQRIETEAMLIAVANGAFYGGGMKVCPSASHQDGLFDLMVLTPVSKFEFMKVFPQVFAGTHINHPAVKIFRSKTVTLTSDSFAYADGELIGQLPARAECIPGAGLTWIP